MPARLRSTPLTELVIWPQMDAPWDHAWIPCEQPERPLDAFAATEHYRHGEPCAACAIARDAAHRRAD